MEQVFQVKMREAAAPIQATRHLSCCLVTYCSFTTFLLVSYIVCVFNVWAQDNYHTYVFTEIAECCLCARHHWTRYSEWYFLLDTNLNLVNAHRVAKLKWLRMWVISYATCWQLAKLYFGKYTEVVHWTSLSCPQERSRDYPSKIFDFARQHGQKGHYTLYIHWATSTSFGLIRRIFIHPLAFLSNYSFNCEWLQHAIVYANVSDI